MSSAKKLLEKLGRETIDALELRTLLGKLGWSLDRTKGSHEVWVKGHKTFVLATHSKDLLRYQIKQAQAALMSEEK